MKCYTNSSNVKTVYFFRACKSWCSIEHRYIECYTYSSTVKILEMIFFSEHATETRAGNHFLIERDAACYSLQYSYTPRNPREKTKMLRYFSKFSVPAMRNYIKFQLFFIVEKKLKKRNRIWWIWEITGNHVLRISQQYSFTDLSYFSSQVFTIWVFLNNPDLPIWVISQQPSVLSI